MWCQVQAPAPVFVCAHSHVTSLPGANYTGEILEWLGFAIAAGTLPAAAFAFYTFSNIAPRAHKHHLWYKQKFEDYPSSRRAVIPGVW